MSVTDRLLRISIAGFLNKMSFPVNIPKVTPKFVVKVTASVPAVRYGSLYKLIFRYLKKDSYTILVCMKI